MQYFRNYELLKLYPVAEGSIRNWIDAARKGKNKLALTEHDGKYYIANTARNLAALDQLVKQGKKYAPKGTRKTVSPSPEFYKLFSRAQVFDIFSNIMIHREIPRQYNYFDGGAERWDEYAGRLAAEDVPNIINSTVRLLDMNRSYFDARLTRCKAIN